jgi:hypothetical protein
MPKYERFKAFGMEFPLPRFAVHALGIVVVVGVALTVWRQYTDDPEHRELISKEQRIQQLAAEVEEYSLHAMENPERHELLEDADGKLIVRVYRDHCVLIQRQSIRGVRSKLVIDLARTNISSANQVHPPSESAFVVYASDRCQGGCPNPHGGKFTWWYGAMVQGGWVEVWRAWPEGCRHVQLFHPATGSWETNPDGTPRVRWTCCVH